MNEVKRDDRITIQEETTNLPKGYRMIGLAPRLKEWREVKLIRSVRRSGHVEKC